MLCWSVLPQRVIAIWFRPIGDGVKCVRCGLFGFFFQAEDGIRDLTVTGVQTCALPILDSKDIEIETTLSIKYDSINASNGDITWTRFPLEVLAFYRMPKFRLGGGLTYHMSPKLKASGAAGNFNVKVDDAAGAVLQADYLVTRKLSVGGRYPVPGNKGNGV